MRTFKRGIYFAVKLWLPVFLVIIGCVGGGCKKKEAVKDKDKEEVIIKKPTVAKISDLVLIYHGGAHRLDWNSGQLKHYIFRDVNNKPEWLFDGFLFLEINSLINGNSYRFDITTPTTSASGKLEWEWLLNRTFAEGKGPDAIEHTLDSLTAKGFPPPSKRKVVMALPNPMYGSTWGTIDNNVLNLNKADDRLKAANWYIDRVREIWKSKNYKHIELFGFYWLHETIDSKNGDDALVAQIGSRLSSLNLDFNWIPYSGAEKADKWKDLKFDVAYQQPNYFFNTSLSIGKLTGGVDYAIRYDMELEMEFDNNVSQPVYRQRFYDYVQVFEDKGVWENRQVAYYEGGGAWLNMMTSKDVEMQKMAKTLGDIVVKRQLKVIAAK